MGRTYYWKSSPEYPAEQYEALIEQKKTERDALIAQVTAAKKANDSNEKLKKDKEALKKIEDELNDMRSAVARIEHATYSQFTTNGIEPRTSKYGYNLKPSTIELIKAHFPISGLNLQQKENIVNQMCSKLFDENTEYQELKKQEQKKSNARWDLRRDIDATTEVIHNLEREINYRNQEISECETMLKLAREKPPKIDPVAKQRQREQMKERKRKASTLAHDDETMKKMLEDWKNNSTAYQL